MYKLIRQIKNALKELQEEELNRWVPYQFSSIIFKPFYLEFQCGKFKYLKDTYSEEQMYNLLNNIFINIDNLIENKYVPFESFERWKEIQPFKLWTDFNTTK